MIRNLSPVMMVLIACIFAVGSIQAGPTRPEPVFSASPGQDNTRELQKSEVQGRIKGRIVDYETQQPLEGVSIHISGAEQTALSGSTGEYELNEIPVGFYSLTFQFPGYYSDTRTDIIVRPQRITTCNIQMLAGRRIEEEATVTAEYFTPVLTQPGSRREFNQEELRRDAGSVGDLSRVLYVVPGIVKVDEIANDLIVRGGHPMENGFYIDNIFVPNINHFPQMGSTGGNVSWLNMDFVENMNVLTGGYDASFGNRLSSIIDIGYREGNRERINGQVNFGIINYGAQIEGPLPGNKGSFLISAHRSFLTAIADLVNDSGFPSFYDLQGKFTYDLDDRNRLSLFTMAGHSQTKEDEANNPLDFSIEKYNTATAGINWRFLWGDSGYSDTALSYSSLRGGEDTWRTADHLPLFSYDYDTQWLTLRNVTRLQLSDTHQLQLGFEVQRTGFRYVDEYDSVEKNKNGTFGAVFAGWTVYPFSNFSLTGSLRADYFPFSKRVHLLPRLSFAWEISRRLTIKGAYGSYVQQMPLFLLSQHPDNSSLRDPQARHIILGLTYLMRQDTQLTIEVYDKSYKHFPMDPGFPYYFVVDDVQGDETTYYNFGRLIDVGRAFARGVEFSIQKKLARNFYGLVSFTYYRARYRDLMGVWRNRLFDHRHILCLSGGYKPNKFWEFSVRWIWSGNKSFTPVNENASLRYGYRWVDYDSIMSGHLSDYRTLSARVDRRFYWKKTNLVLYAGALNALDQENEVYRLWMPAIGAYESEHMWGIIPYVGLEFEF